MGWNDDVITQFRESTGTENYWGPKLVILHSIGAKSGETHLNPVVGFRNDEGWRVVASKGGTPENPAWYHNLRAHPEFEIEALVDGEVVTVPVTATEIADDEWQDAYGAIVAEEPQFGGYLEKIAGNGGGIPPAELAEAHEAVEREAGGIARCVEGIQELGGMVKDVGEGLVDFLARREGQDVLLCWRLGEDEIEHWHGLEEGFAGRKPL